MNRGLRPLMLCWSLFYCFGIRADVVVQNKTGEPLYGGIYYLYFTAAKLFEDKDLPGSTGILEIGGPQMDFVAFDRPGVSLRATRYFVFSADKKKLKKKMSTEEFNKLDSIGVGRTSLGRDIEYIIIRKDNGQLRASISDGLE